MNRIKTIILLLGLLAHSTPVFALRAGEVFIRFAREQLGRDFRKTMGNDWPRRIMAYTAEWTEWESEEFLRILRGRIGDSNAVKRVKRASYFEFMRLGDFKDRLEHWDDYIGTEHANNRLSHSLGGFDRGTMAEIQGNTKALERYVRRQGAQTIARNNLHGFTRSQPYHLKQTFSYVERYFGPIDDAGKKAVAEISMTNFEALATTNLIVLRGNLGYLDEYLGRGNRRAGRLKARPIVLKYYSAVASTRRDKLRSLTATLQQYLTRDKAEQTLIDYFSRVVGIDPIRLRRTMEGVEQFFGGKPQLTGETLIALADTDPDALLARLESLRSSLGLEALRSRLFEDFSLEAIETLEVELLGSKPKADPCIQLPFKFL